VRKTETETKIETDRSLENTNNDMVHGQWASKGHPGCIGVQEEKGHKFCHCWQLHKREALCGKRQAPLSGSKKMVAKMAGKPSKTKQPSLQVCKAHWDQKGSNYGSELCVTFSRADISSMLLAPCATSFGPTALHLVFAWNNGTAAQQCCPAT
jgi:hypothetical protein